MDQILKWFTGKSLENAKAALELLRASEAQDGWVRGASRKVHAALSKANVARKFANANEKAMDAFGCTDDTKYQEKNKALHASGFGLFMAMAYGAAHGRHVDIDLLAKAARNEQEREIVGLGRRYLADFRPVYDLIHRLDATRPRPVITSLGVSPTVTATLKQFEAVAVEVAEIEFKRVEIVNPQTKKTEYHSVCIIHWPAGTLHATSRFAQGSGRNRQCEACGHAIKNAFNWVPLVIRSADGTPRSLWVGKDCARNLFNIDVQGDVELEAGVR